MALPTRRSREYTRLIRIASKRYKISPHVLAGLIEVESNFEPGAKSGAGARGLTQFMPGTAATHGVKYGGSHHAVATQILGAAKYLNELGYQHDNRGALAAYNGGPGNPQMGYANTVLERAQKYRSLNHGGKVSARRKSESRTVKTSKTIPGVDNSALRQEAKLAYLATRGKPGGLLELKDSLDAAKDVPAQRVVTTKKVKLKGHKSAKKHSHNGRVVFEPGADRAGVPTRHYLKRELKRFSGAAGIPFDVGTGSNHKQYTTSGNISDHWSGRGADILVGGDARTSRAVSRKGDLIAGRTLMSLGLSRAQARKLARQGGIHNINYHGHRYQVIWKAADHYDHVHVGIR
jgi:transglycosylase-like protein with SLT domain